MNKGLIVYAPNVHTGGGLVLLNWLLATQQQDIEPITAFLDERARETIVVSEKVNISWVMPTVSSRFKAELLLRKAAGSSGKVFCFHNLPPILPLNASISVFFQNVNVLDSSGLAGGTAFVRARILFERYVFHTFKKRIDKFYVQTPSVRQLLIYKGGVAPDKIVISPFHALKKGASVSNKNDREGFVYVADGVGHKNHHNLIKAWSLLGDQGFFPILKLTLGGRDKELWLVLKKIIDEKHLCVENVGYLPFSEVTRLYQSAEALMFSSLKESFGLPLIEAEFYGLPIIAPELDYVRDVCSPVESFDPMSPLSMARAVLRFKGWGCDQIEIISPDDFLKRVFHSS
jgi:glycosyltransferase involved in cell wall biosynthesis